MVTDNVITSITILLFSHLQFRPGWRPGAINRKVINIMRAVKKAAGLKLRPLLKKTGEAEDSDNRPQLPPTLHIHRRNGSYYISMHPMNLEPEENNVPLQFRIPAKKKDEEGDGDSCVCDQSETSSDLEIEFMAPGVYWPSDKDRKTVQTQCFESEFLPDPEQQLLMDLKANGPTNSNSKGKDKKAGKKGPQGKGTNKNKGNLTHLDPDTSPRLVGWDQDDQPTAVGRKKQ